MKKAIIYVIAMITMISLLFPNNERTFAVSADDVFQCWNCDRFNYRSACNNCRLCGWDFCSQCGACRPGCSEDKDIGVKINNTKNIITIALFFIFAGFFIVMIVFVIIAKINFRKDETTHDIPLETKDPVATPTNDQRSSKQLDILENQSRQSSSSQSAGKMELWRTEREDLKQQILDLKPNDLIVHKKFGRMMVISTNEDITAVVVEKTQQPKMFKTELLYTVLYEVIKQ